MPLRFTDPDDLMEIFSTLEEQNLFMIEHCQYGEMKLEEKKQEEKEVKAQKQDEVDKTRAKEKQNAEKIRRLMQQKNAITGVDEDEEGKGIELADQVKLEIGCAELYRAAKSKGTDKTDKSLEQKILNSTDLALIEETEFILNNYFEEFEFIEKTEDGKFAHIFQNTWKEIKRQKRVDNQKIQTKVREQNEKAIAEQRAFEKNARHVKKFGKPMMRAIAKPPVKRLRLKRRF